MHLCQLAANPSLGPLHHPAAQRMEWHSHGLAHLTLVLSGRFGEAGALGRRNLLPGEVVIRGSFDPHFNLIGAAGAIVLVLPNPPRSTAGFGRVEDPDFLVRLAERDAREASACMAEQLQPLDPVEVDWPDVLAGQLRRGWTGSLAGWASQAGIRPETLSRVFARMYGCSPRQYRVSVRGRAALMQIRQADRCLADIAAGLGFSDQSHMCRTVRDLTGWTPRQLRS